MSRTTLIDGTIYFLVGVLCLGEGYYLAVTADPDTLQQALRPGVYIFTLGVILVAISIVHLIAYRGATSDNVGLSREMKLLVGSIALLLAGYAVAIYLFGYTIASVLFFFAAFMVFGVKSWLTTSLLTISFVVVCYLVFVKLCSVNFPPGVLISWG